MALNYWKEALAKDVPATSLIALVITFLPDRFDASHCSQSKSQSLVDDFYISDYAIGKQRPTAGNLRYFSDSEKRPAGLHALAGVVFGECCITNQSDSTQKLDSHTTPPNDWRAQTRLFSPAPEPLRSDLDHLVEEAKIGRAMIRYDRIVSSSRSARHYCICHAPDYRCQCVVMKRVPEAWPRLPGASRCAYHFTPRNC